MLLSLGITGGVSPVPRKNNTSKGDISPFRLKTLSLYVARIVSAAETILEWKTTSGSRLILTCLDILDYDQDIGFSCLRSQQPLALFQLSFHRKPSEETDHIYGIQQIFGYRLGKSARPGESGTTLQALEVEFGAKMLERDPVHSQLHTFLKAPEDGDGWRMNRSSEILPRLNSGELIQRLCLLSYRSGRVSEGPMAHFDGMVLPFSKIRESLQSNIIRYVSVDVDRIPELKDSPEIVENHSQSLFAFIDWVCTTFPDDISTEVAQVIVLLLGRTRESIEKEGSGEISKLLAPFRPSQQAEYSFTNFGLILHRRSGSHMNSQWKRFGIVTWDVIMPLVENSRNDSSQAFVQDLAILLGSNDAGWQPRSGTFG